MIPGFKPPRTNSANAALRYFGVAFAFLVAGLVALLLNSVSLAAGDFASTHVIGGLHLITLGWLTLSIFGALQVFIGVALGTQPYGDTLASWVLGIWSLGAGFFACGLAFQIAPLVIFGALLLGLGLLFFSIQLVPALWLAKRNQTTRYYVTLSLASLWVVWLLGGAAACARAGGSISLPPGYFSSHVLIAIFGWVGAMVAGVGSHLIPMFALSRGTSQWPVRLALPIWALIPIAGAAGAFFPTPWTMIGWTAAALASALWFCQVILFMLTRIRRERDAGLLLAVFATGLLPISWIVLLTSGRPLLFVGLLIFGWLTLFTLGIYHRVVPFLVWFVRFSSGMGQWRLPKVKDLLDDRFSLATLVLSAGGILVWIVGLAFMKPPVVCVGASALLLASLCAAVQIRFLTRDFAKKTLAQPTTEQRGLQA